MKSGITVYCSSIRHFHGSATKCSYGMGGPLIVGTRHTIHQPGAGVPKLFPSEAVTHTGTMNSMRSLLCFLATAIVATAQPSPEDAVLRGMHTYFEILKTGPSELSSKVEPPGRISLAM